MYTLLMILQQSDSGDGSGGLGGIIGLILLIAEVAGMWMLFTKAGKPGWHAIIPILNLITLFQVSGKPWWWVILLIIPVVNFIILVLVMINLSKAFGKGIGFAIGLIFLGPIFIPILGFGKATYQGAPA